MRPALLSAATFAAVLTSSAFNISSDVHRFGEPIDALSVTLPAESATAQISYLTNGAWSTWQRLEVENEQDPTLLESNMIMFPYAVTQVKLRGTVTAVHPITVSHEPAHFDVAATREASKPRILSRDEWGADPSLLYRKPSPVTSSSSSSVSNDQGDNGDNGGGGTVSQRVKDCNDAVVNWPNEFKTSNHQSKDSNGETLRWARDYSNNIKLIAVHHTAVSVAGDIRTGEERIRALYAFHANNRGWGDIGYHYLVDETGQIYEGKSGGLFVVGGHAYCNNIGTIGVALLGNFDIEQPTQEQMKSLQWLLAYLGDTYDVPSGNVKFHGKTMPTIVGHRDLLSTSCPGKYAYDALPQVRAHVASGQVDASVTFPSIGRGTYKDSTDERRQKRLENVSSDPAPTFGKQGISPLGTTTLTGRPGEQALFSMRYQAGSSRMQEGAKIGEVSRSEQGIGLWQEKDGAFARIASSVTLPEMVPVSGSTQLRFKIQYPATAGSYTLTIGGWTYQIEVSGRRNRAVPTASQFQRAEQSSSRSSVVRVSSASSKRSTVAPTYSSSSAGTVQGPSQNIRIKLTQTGQLGILMNNGTINGSKTSTSRFTLSQNGNNCVTTAGSTTIDNAIIRFAVNNGLVTITDDRGSRNLRGTVECRVVDGTMILINELPLEQYMWGLAEEPDTEPFEKQRAFAIAARTYAAYYMNPSSRKFPGKPYDGSDSPADFQYYKGVDFETSYSEWVRAVKDTEGQVLTKNGQLIRPPYFSSDDGRTRSPSEVGWKTFPFAEVFTSKEDPWCAGMQLRGHGVGMSGCGAEGQANEGKSGEDILSYYYTGTSISRMR